MCPIHPLSVQRGSRGARFPAAFIPPPAHAHLLTWTAAAAACRSLFDGGGRGQLTLAELEQAIREVLGGGQPQGPK